MSCLRSRGIYSYQFAELGKGKKKSASKKRGGKISQGNDDKKGIKGKRGKNREKREAVGKKKKAVRKRGKQWEKEGSRGKKRKKEAKRGKRRE